MGSSESIEGVVGLEARVAWYARNHRIRRLRGKVLRGWEGEGLGLAFRKSIPEGHPAAEEFDAKSRHQEVLSVWQTVFLTLAIFGAAIGGVFASQGALWLWAVAVAVMVILFGFAFAMVREWRFRLILTMVLMSLDAENGLDVSMQGAAPFKEVEGRAERGTRVGANHAGPKRAWAEAETSGDSEDGGWLEQSAREERPRRQGGSGEQVQSWHVGQIVDAGFIRNCQVVAVVRKPNLCYLLITPHGKQITFFPHGGITSGWIDES